MRCAKLFGLTVVAMFGLAASAQATLINVDFGTAAYTQTGAAVLGASGDTWNVTGKDFGASTTNFLNSSGVATGVSLTRTGSGGSTEEQTKQDSENTGAFAMDAATTNLMKDCIGIRGSAGNSRVFDFSGLTANAAYTMVVYGSTGWPNDRSVFSLNGGASESPACTTCKISDGEGVAYVVLDGAADSAGHLYLTMAIATGASFAPIEGVQIQSVPEPGTLAMLAGSLLGIVAYAWRKRK